MAEGDTIHRVARRLEAALGGLAIEVADAPSAQSRVRRRAGELSRRTLEASRPAGSTC
jgi:hypothetical protein